MTHSTVSPTTDSWLSTGAGRTGITYTYYVWLQDKTAVPHADAVGATQDENEVTWNAALHTG